MKDNVGSQQEELEEIFRLSSDLFRLHGYMMISTPILEPAGLFTRTIGEASDIVKKEMYSFEDRGGEVLALRPEGTAPIMRAYLEGGLKSRGLPQKLFYYGPMFRRERPQAGRYRQFHQVGAEVLGSDSPLADAEIISISAKLFGALGVQDYTLLLNSLGCRKCQKDYLAILCPYLEEVKEDLCEQCLVRARQSPLRIFDCKEASCQDALSHAPMIVDFLCEGCGRHFSELQEYLDLMGINYRVEPLLARGLDYYSRTAFEYQFDELGAKSTVSAGGRYDYLAEELGGSPTPGVGFSLGVERLLILLRSRGKTPLKAYGLDVYVAPASASYKKAALLILERLRSAKIRSDTDFLDRSLKAQMRAADRLGAKLVLIVGEEERQRNVVVLRDLAGKKQWEIPVEDIEREVNNFLERKRVDDGDG
ncbi:MAG: histidine--tRNA ligase [Actinomycetota bacterium]|nr:histidine--tRNA ligase [Actinomycetota bacterium]